MGKFIEWVLDVRTPLWVNLLGILTIIISAVAWLGVAAAALGTGHPLAVIGAVLPPVFAWFAAWQTFKSRMK